ncbi:MAG TPA: DsbC family protein [Hydrogenophaga sp.]
MNLIKTTLLAVLAAVSFSAVAQEAVIRKNLAARLPNLPTIDEVKKTPMPGLYEIRVNESDVYYTDAKGDFLIQGSLIDTKARVDLTEQRVNQLSAVAFSELPLKDSFTIVRGKGERKLVVFEDPNCGYCKRFERDLAKIDNVTVHVLLYPILSPDSAEKSRNIWCAKEPGKTFEDWMVGDVTPPAANCDTAPISRNLAFGKKARITGTPTMFFADGTRVPGAIPADRVEKLLSQIKP